MRNLVLVLVASILVALVLCVGCGGGGSDAPSAGTATVEGRIANVHAQAPSKSGGIMLSLVEVLSTERAFAQVGTSGITVIARQRERDVDVDTTGPDGTFGLSVEPGTVTIVFVAESFNLSLDIDVPQESDVSIVVTLSPGSPTPVVIDDMKLKRAAIRCETGSLDFVSPPGADIVIDGGGEDCIRAKGFCSLMIDSREISLTNCERCVDAEGSAEVTLRADEGNIDCTAREDGIRARGEASVAFDSSGGAIEIYAVGHGIRAEGVSFVELIAPSCSIEGLEDPLFIEGNAVVDTTLCILLDFIEGLPI